MNEKTEHKPERVRVSVDSERLSQMLTSALRLLRNDPSTEVKVIKKAKKIE